MPNDTKRLQFDYAAHSEERCGQSYDVLQVEVDYRVVGVGVVDICKTTPSRLGSVDVSPFAGKRVRVRFVLVTDYPQGSAVTTDNVALSNTLSAISVPTAVAIP